MCKITSSQRLSAAQVALVTGGGSGIGFEIARQLGRHSSRKLPEVQKHLLTA